MENLKKELRRSNAKVMCLEDKVVDLKNKVADLEKEAVQLNHELDIFCPYRPFVRVRCVMSFVKCSSHLIWECHFWWGNVNSLVIVIHFRVCYSIYMQQPPIIFSTSL